MLAAFTHPEILIGTIGYLFLKPALKRSGLVDTRKGAYKSAMIAYNVGMAVFSLACFVATTTALGWDRGYGSWLLTWFGDVPAPLYVDACPPPVFRSKLFMLAVKGFYYSKHVHRDHSRTRISTACAAPLLSGCRGRWHAETPRCVFADTWSTSTPYGSCSRANPCPSCRPSTTSVPHGTSTSASSSRMRACGVRMHGRTTTHATHARPNYNARGRTTNHTTAKQNHKKISLASSEGCRVLLVCASLHLSERLRAYRHVRAQRTEPWRV